MRNKRTLTRLLSPLLALGMIALVGTSAGCKASSALSYDGDQLLGGTVAPGTTTSTANAIRAIRPGLAVRGMACLACHANIQASVITDFGSGNNWYLDQNLTDGSGHPRTTASLFGQAYYNPYSWQSMQQVNGQLIIPNATVPDYIVQSTIQGGSTSMSLSDYMNSPDADNQSSFWTSQYWNTGGPTSSHLPFAGFPSPGLDDQGNPIPPTQTYNFLYIGAPTANQILALAPRQNITGPWIQNMNGGATPNGLSFFTGLNGTWYLTNTGPIQCMGEDLIINGTLLLNNALLYAGLGGCRLYVTGSVFIEGPITYLNSEGTPDPSQNLQITSATSIIMGVGINGSVFGGGNHEGSGGTAYNWAPLHNRLIDDSRNAVFRSAPDAASYRTWANSVMAEAQNIGPNLLQDASVIGLNSATATSASGQTRLAINYDHLLLNAPVIHSRYLGRFSGVIVAEIAVFSLGEFQFQFDDVFADPTTPVLPGLPIDILCAGDPSTCLAVNPTPTPAPSPTPTPTPSPPPDNGGGGIIGI